MAILAHPVAEGLAGACFAPDYAGARARFLAAAARAGARVDVFVNDVACAPDGGTLTTDVAVIGPADADRALLVFSGTHGPEGFVGSAAQVALLDSIATGARWPGIRIVLVHAINPWGFAHLSRTTENNVDLNRNFIDWSAGPPSNPAYEALHAVLCPDRWTPAALATSDANRLGWIERNGLDAYVDMTSRGQYTHPDGLNYGGKGPEWSNRTVQSIVARHLSSVRRIAVIDWHTALGERGQPFFLCFNEPGDAGWERACAWWGRDRVEGDTGGFGGAGRPRYTGLLFYGVQRYAAHAEVTGAVIEFGTVSMDEGRIALQGDRLLKFGEPVDDTVRTEIRQRIIEAFSPTSMQWKQSTLGWAIGIHHATLGGLARWS